MICQRPGCGKPLPAGLKSGARFCSPYCRKKHSRERIGPVQGPAALRFALAGLSDEQLRAYVRDELERRQPEGGRFRVRFGPYHPKA